MKGRKDAQTDISTKEETSNPCTWFSGTNGNPWRKKCFETTTLTRADFVGSETPARQENPVVVFTYFSCIAGNLLNILL